MKIFFEKDYSSFVDYIKTLKSFPEKPFVCSKLVYVPEFIAYYTEDGQARKIQKGGLICFSDSLCECLLEKQRNLGGKILDIMAVRCRFNQE